MNTKYTKMCGTFECLVFFYWMLDIVNMILLIVWILFPLNNWILFWLAVKLLVDGDGDGRDGDGRDGGGCDGDGDGDCWGSVI